MGTIERFFANIDMRISIYSNGFGENNLRGAFRKTARQANSERAGRIYSSLAEDLEVSYIQLINTDGGPWSRSRRHPAIDPKWVEVNTNKGVV